MLDKPLDENKFVPRSLWWRNWYYKDDVRYTKSTFDNGLYIAYYYDTKYWHNISGPARIWKVGHPNYPNGHQEWYIMGEQIPVNSQQEFEKYLKMKAFW